MTVDVSSKVPEAVLSVTVQGENFGGRGDLAEHEAEELGQPPGLGEDGPHLLPCL